MAKITIYVGIDTVLSMDFSDYNWDAVQKVIFTIKNKSFLANNPPVIQVEFPRDLFNDGTGYTRHLLISAEDSLKVAPGAEYDFVAVLDDDTWIKVGETGWIECNYSIGQKGETILPTPILITNTESEI